MNLYLDKDFGPKSKDDEKGHKFSLWKDGEPPQPGYPKPSAIEWVHG